MTETKTASQWLRYPEAEAYLQNLLKELLTALPPLDLLREQMLRHTSTRLYDWLDHLVLADGDAVRARLAELGFEQQDVPAVPNERVFAHPGATFPRLVLRTDDPSEAGTVLSAAIQVEQIAAFLMAQGVAAPIEGTPYSPYRRTRVWTAGDRSFYAVERRGHRGMVPVHMPPAYAGRYCRAYEEWATRPRHFEDLRIGMQHTLALARALVEEMGVDTAAWIAFSAERAYWQQRNRAGRVQKLRQDALGLGWANHDHHTFRSSRAVYTTLIEVLETFGLRPRERFYAGAEAGWGAQVMEQPVAGLLVFADVDLSPDEVSGDFAHQPLPPQQEMGTVGLWCALHGEALLEAGLHHLAARVDFERIDEDLASWDVAFMAPFSDFPYLRQSFTRGERWSIEAQRLERLSRSGQIDAAQQDRFGARGAVGSHLEKIQRADGFKGFNQQAVSDIIRRTDPRVVAGA